MKPIRTAIIGTGSIAQAHVTAALTLAPRVEVVGALDIDANRLKEFCDKNKIVRSYTDLAALLEKERPDLVQICTPPGTHCDLSVQSLRAGAWVLCEKPLCGSLAELDRIAAAEKETGCYCSSVFQWRFGSAGQHVRSLIESNAMGKPLVGICQTTWYRDLEYYAVPWRGKWNTELGGPTMGLGIHAMDFFLWLLGDWHDVRAIMGTLDRPIEVEDLSLAMVRFENGAHGSIINSALSPRQETYLRLDFQKSTVELKTLYGYCNADWQFSVARNSPHLSELEKWKTIPTDVRSSHAAQLAAIVESRLRNERPLTSGAEARRTIEFLTALYKSAITGEAVRRGSIQKGDPFYERLHGPVSGRPKWA
jgi:predicted dehydrogenase